MFFVYKNQFLFLKNDKKKFFKRGDLLAQEKEMYLESQDKHKESTSTPEKNSDSRKLFVGTFIEC